MAKYIDNKQINPSKSNDVEDLKGIGMAIWNFMSSIYQSKWDSLNANNNRKSLRDKITAKLSPRVIPQPSCNNKPMEKLVPASIEKMPPLLPAKLKNEVNQIFKYFKSTSTKSHAQALKLNTNTNEVIKIKDTFTALNAQKIDQIQKIINGAPKLKPCIQMTTKDPSRKQVIIPMSSDNIKKFMENSSLYVININHSLRNTKSEVLVDFICTDNSNITVVTNKMSRLQEVDLAFLIFFSYFYFILYLFYF